MESVKQLLVGNVVSSPIIVSESTSISKVVGILKKEDAYEVFTQDHGMVDMVMIRDILKSSNVATEKVGSLVLHVPNLQPRTPIAQAARLMMQYRLRALPVVEGEKLLGCVTATSIIRTIPTGALEKYRAQDIMTPNPVSLTGGDEVSKARNLMLRRRIDHLPVVEDHKLRGVLTSSQIVFSLYQPIEGVEPRAMVDEIRRRLDPPVKSLMDTNPLTAAPSEKIANLLRKMLDMRATYCVISQFDEVQGIVTYRDFMKLIAEEIVRSDAPVYVVGLPDDPFEAEQTRTKFTRVVETLRRSSPYIEEARAVIRTREGAERERRRYEVTVTLVTPRRNFVYSANGFDLANIFDDVTKHLKSMMAERPKPRRESPRFEEPGP